jgi:glycerol-1-phosphate dehydrogenase [NAD(P)+]
VSTSLTVGPIDLDTIRGRLGLGKPGSSLAPIGIRHLVIEDHALDRLPSIVDEIRLPGPTAVVMDTTDMRHAETSLKPEVLARLGTDRDVRAISLGEHGVELHVDAATLETAARAVEGAGCVVAVGSGTVCDIAKEASRTHTIPLIVVQTANSVNAFSDDMAVILRDGVKRTVQSRWPDALVADLSVIAEAPLALNQSGIGELASMFTAPADWYLAGSLGMDPTWDRRVVDLFHEGRDDFASIAAGVKERDLTAIRDACVLMTLSGLALGMAGRTAPLSGTEHTVSHLLDMSAGAAGRPTGLHGAQVGVASVAVAVAWERLLDELDPERLLTPPPDLEAALRSRVTMAFSSLDPSGRMAAECWSDVDRKLNRLGGLGPQLGAFVREWDRHRAELRGLLGSAAEIASALSGVGAPRTFPELDPPIDDEVARWALWNGHLLRDRFTMSDLAWLASIWSEQTAGDAIEAAATFATAP